MNRLIVAFMGLSDSGSPFSLLQTVSIFNGLVFAMIDSNSKEEGVKKRSKQLCKNFACRLDSCCWASLATSLIIHSWIIIVGIIMLKTTFPTFILTFSNPLINAECQLIASHLQQMCFDLFRLNHDPFLKIMLPFSHKIEKNWPLNMFLKCNC